MSAAMPNYQPSRRQQEYHSSYQHAQPHSPMHSMPYQNYGGPPPQHYYTPPPQIHYPQQPRWTPQYNPGYPPQQQQQQQHHQMRQQYPQSPVVVSTPNPYGQPQPSPQVTRPPLPPHAQSRTDYHSPARIQPQIQYHSQAFSTPPPINMKQEQAQAPLLPEEIRPKEEHVKTIVEEPISAVQPKAPTPAPASRRESTAQSPLSLAPEHKTPFYPALPWYSVPESIFPRRDMARRRRTQKLHRTTDTVALPAAPNAPQQAAPALPKEPSSEVSTIAAPSEPETPATSQAPSESDFTQVSTPATPAHPSADSPKITPTQTHVRRDTRSAIAVPNIPGLPKQRASPPAAPKQDVPLTTDTEQTTPTPETQPAAQADEPQAPVQEQEEPKTPPPKAAPKSWADLVRTKGANGAAAQANGAVITNGSTVPKSATLSDALRQYSVEHGVTLSFLEPRGLVNTGNMCYMNSILQILVFCAPFYDFLDQVRQRTVHSLKSDTPLVDAMIMFMREFKVLSSAESMGSLQRTLNQQQLEQYGEAFAPEYVYDAIRKLPRFNGMRRGHQQDAEEFMGFLLEELHDEFALMMSSAADEKPQTNGALTPSVTESPSSGDGWLEVGPKQKASVTRTAGHQEAPTPVTKIFGGNLRSELRVPGLKDSVTLEPYKPLQLDIGASHVNNIIDALKGITRTETLTGDFGGRSNTAKKQVFIDTLPPVLVLHLKRFEYNSSMTGTQKIWKKIGYPLELEIPKEVFTPAKRSGLAVKGGTPKYKLIGVVYHHGKSAAGGHYTVDLLRQDGREWIRIDDTFIRRIRPEDVAEGGAEEDPKILAKALEQHKADQDLQKQRNIFQGLDEADREPEEEKPWSEVNGQAAAKKQWSAAVTTNGTATPTSTNGKRTPTAKKEGVKDNKVAYILLYEKISG
ncbi:hypothetical protein LTR78_005887 [Recurvomyces mirabilis]|uniref:Ubiquitin carboxyl-terminal hydrolase n=1 Tax=Recurvomyces mirabilis TaxID=574656 RepID=A0AAE0WMJ1_9PEZI|nr:hypothetical protein LTR78_005887 [Recurvomyces mirabilis]KAK5154268.1 hypothetical protein LTS14_006953 [Recurvomyces mirabilis]